MRSNSKTVREAVKNHILASVMNSEGQEFTNIKEAANYMNSEFIRVAGHEYNLRKFPNTQERFSDYLNGLPFNFEFYYEDIKNFLNGLGINPEGKEYSDDQSAKMYHYLIYSEMTKNL